MFKSTKSVARAPQVGTNDPLKAWTIAAFAALAVVVALYNPAGLEAGSPTSETESPAYDLPTSVGEARGRARILHEAIHGALQVVHRDFFDEENIHTIPSRSLEDVFVELERSYGVSVRWLAVNAKALNVDHKPSDEIEQQAVRALSSGKDEFESYQAGEYRHFGSIRLASQCLKCHLPTRSSNKDRLAGLSIVMKVDEDRTTADAANQ